MCVGRTMGFKRAAIDLRNAYSVAARPAFAGLAIALIGTLALTGCGPQPGPTRPVLAAAPASPDALVLATSSPVIRIEAARPTAFTPGSGALAAKQWRIVDDADA